MVGECFIYDTPPNGAHLFVVIAPGSRPDYFLAVNVTTNREGCEQTCLLAKGEHAFLTADVSAVMYARAREFPKAIILRSAQPPMPAGPLLRIQQAALSPTSRLPKGAQRLIQQWLDR